MENPFGFKNWEIENGAHITASILWHELAFSFTCVDHDRESSARQLRRVGKHHGFRAVHGSHRAVSRGDATSVQ